MEIKGVVMQYYKNDKGAAPRLAHCAALRFRPCWTWYHLYRFTGLVRCDGTDDQERSQLGEVKGALCAE